MANGQAPQPVSTLRALDPANPTHTVELTIVEDDVAALLDGPGHHVHELQHLVPQVVRKQSCVAVFEGLRQDGGLAGGRAYCGRPARAFTNAGEETPPHEGMCFVVFVNEHSQIFDWDWVPCANGFGLPVDWAQRFQEPLWINLRDVERGEHISDGTKEVSFARSGDYQEFLCTTLGLQSQEELERYGALISQVQADWHRQGQNGCLFARVLNSDRPGYGWTTTVVPRSGVAEATARVVEETSAGIERADVRIVSFLFPWMTSAEDLAALLKALGEAPGWTVTTTALDAEHTNVAVRLALERGTVTSWVLGFGPFTFLPMTRRSPFTELVVLVKPKVPGQHRMDDDMTRAHLADVPVSVLGDPEFKGLVERTAAHRLFILGGDEEEKRAKAKVTITVPSAAWEAGER